MISNHSLKSYPHRHILGIEGLYPDSIKYLLDLSNKFANHLTKKKNENSTLKNKICINLFLKILLVQEPHLS